MKLLLHTLAEYAIVTTEDDIQLQCKTQDTDLSGLWFQMPTIWQWRTDGSKANYQKTSIQQREMS